MAGATQRTEQRKRNRKRKRRNVSLSSSSSSSESSDSSSDEKQQQVVKLPAATKTSKASPLQESSSGSSSDDDDENSSASESEDGETQPAPKFQTSTSHHSVPSNAQEENPRLTSGASDSRTRQPSPPPIRNVPAPQLIPSRDTAGNLSSADAEKEKVLKDKFRKFWMSSIADAFSDDLNEIRKEPNLNQSRLGLLVDSLASGADLYSSSREMGGGKVNEIEIILGHKSSS